MENIVNVLKGQASFRSLGQVAIEEIKKVEQDLRLKFAEEYKTYVQEFGAVTFDGHELTGICSFPRLNVMNVSEEEWSLNPYVPKDWYVIEQTNMDGAVIWQRTDGTVFQTVQGGKPKQIAESLADYIIKS